MQFQLRLKGAANRLQHLLKAEYGFTATLQLNIISLNLCFLPVIFNSTTQYSIRWNTRNKTRQFRPFKATTGTNSNQAVNLSSAIVQMLKIVN